MPQGYDRAMRWTDVPAAAWRTPQELVQEGLRRSRVVMLNEAHNGLTRCVRTGQLGRQLLPSAHAMGIRHLAMEALQPGDAETANATRQPPEAAGGLTGQAQLGVAGQHQPGPPVGLLRMARPRGRPTKGLLTEPNGVFQVEPAHIGPPDQIQV